MHWEGKLHDIVPEAPEVLKHWGSWTPGQRVHKLPSTLRWALSRRCRRSRDILSGAGRGNNVFRGAGRHLTWSCDATWRQHGLVKQNRAYSKQGSSQWLSELDTISAISILHPGVLPSTNKRAPTGWMHADKNLKVSHWTCQRCTLHGSDVDSAHSQKPGLVGEAQG